MLFSSLQIRSQAAKALVEIVYEGRSANDILAVIEFENPADLSLYKSLVLNSCRYFIRLEAAANKLVQKPIRNKDADIKCLLIIGLYQLEYARVPDHAAIAETVEACEQLKKPWAKNLINGVLRNYLRQQAMINAELDKNWNTKYAMPDWLINKIKPSYKGQVDQILESSNHQAPLTLRVNLAKTSRQQYLDLLNDKEITAKAHELVTSAIVLDKAVNVTQLPKFAEGWVSVQDAAAQLSAWILEPKANMQILDACSAPGGKAAHLLEHSNNQIDLTAIDIDDRRCERIEENLERLELDAQVICYDAIEYLKETEQQFDQILLDVPCSATGVIRRHPDIKLLRRESDIDELVEIQAQMLAQAWQRLKPNGKLLYATCSILQAENSQQITAFLAQQPDAIVEPLSTQLAALSNTDIGCQILPNQQQMDGFYYCLLRKQAVDK
ncbi:MAG: 16S rRNA (cytosine(967)-C(5))-methyltransferase RsmB [Gammaproteobacteria bacterium]|nr:16S rRNA (cytosine(967)-C(5))-methyltransferase RsmB [Gammaproteobacteria bacterium]